MGALRGCSLRAIITIPFYHTHGRVPVQTNTLIKSLFWTKVMTAYGFFEKNQLDQRALVKNAVFD